MNYHVLTLFPEMIESGLKESIIGRAIDAGHIKLNTVNIRDYAAPERKRRVDDYPFGGGAGMLMQAEPIYNAYNSLNLGDKPHRVVYLSPCGKVFNQAMAKELAQEEDLVFLCGHYEGVDQRIIDKIVTDEVSIGDYVLTGGELPAMVMIDAISRNVMGVLSNSDSGIEESFSDGMLEYPQYTRPYEWEGMKAPDVLLCGDPKKIKAWQEEQSLARTRERRPDLLN